MVANLIRGVIHEEILAEIESRVGPVTWQVGHERLARMGARAALDAEEAVWLVVTERLGAHRELGYGGFVEYVSAVLGYDAHTAYERMRVARALVLLPGVYRGLASGELSWSAVRELTRVATVETEGAWLEASRDKRVRDVQRMVSGRRRGDLPTSPVDAGVRRHVVRFEVQGSTLALMRQAQDEYRRRTGESMDDDALVAALARAFLAGEPEATGGAAAQVMVTVCSSCEQGTVDVGGEPVALAPAETERLCCDAEVVPSAYAKFHVGARSHVGPDPVARAVKPSPGVMAEIDRRAGLKVTTKIPKSIRVAVRRRHHGQCAVPGCTHSGWLHFHHCDLRSEGGTHDPNRIVPLCEAHHRAVHDGRLVIEGAWSETFRFLHADGTAYGKRQAPDPRMSEMMSLAFRALCHNGFEQKDARQAIDAITSRVEPEMAIEDVVRMAFSAAVDLPSQRHIFRVREAVAAYLPTWAVAC